jgi:hypothetical protein
VGGTVSPMIKSTEVMLEKKVPNKMSHNPQGEPEW